MAKLEVSDIARSIKGRIREVEEQLKDHKALSDELERLKGALSRLEGEVRARVDGRRRRQRPVTQRTTAHSAKGHLAGEEHQRPRAARGEQEEDPRGAKGRPQDRLGDRNRNRDQGGHHQRVAEQAREGRRGGQGRPRLRAAKVSTNDRK